MAIVTPFKNWTKKSDISVTFLIPLLCLLAYLFDLFLSMEDILPFGTDNILQALERVVGVRIGKAGVVAKRRLSIEVPDGDVAQEGLELPTAQGFDECFGGRAPGPLDGLGHHVRGDVAEHIARLGLIAGTLLELSNKFLVIF